MSPDDRAYMRRALTLAARGRGLVSPNPAVGAVVVREGRIVGEGWHVYSRRDHAEVVALRQAGELARGADLYVTLEPCCHHGRTPPCVDAVLSAGVARVVVAVQDPNPLVAGRGLDRLRRSGVPVECGLMADDAVRLNPAFNHFMKTGHPLVTLKLALSLDGRIGLADGRSKWITGELSRRQVQRLRWTADAVAVGINTVLADDPGLDVRIRGGKRILKVIFDSRLRCPPGARLFDGNPILLFHSERASGAARRSLAGRAELVALPTAGPGLSWPAALRELGARGVQDLLLEGGGKLAAAALASDGVDRMRLFYSARLLGGDALPAVGPLALAELDASPRFRFERVRRIGQDLFLELSRTGDSGA